MVIESSVETDVLIEKIRPEHDDAVCNIIKTVGKAYGAVGEGFGPGDAEVLSMSHHYGDETKSRYIVAIVDGRVVGGCGIASFNNSESVCELRKLFLLPEGRGLGLGKQLTQECLDYARDVGYKQCYLDTLSAMTEAIQLYIKFGFEQLPEPLDGTPHGGCDVWMIMDL